VLMDPAGNRPVEADREAVPVDGPDLVEQDVVRELEARREELDRRRVQEDRTLAVDEQVVARNEARVPGEEAFFGRRVDGRIGFGNEDSIVAIDRDGRRTDLDGQGHGRMIGYVAMRLGWAARSAWTRPREAARA